MAVRLTDLSLSRKPPSRGCGKSGTPLAAKRECARKRRDAVQDALLQGLQPRSCERRLVGSCGKLGRSASVQTLCHGLGLCLGEIAV
jgi:hypothetical protein